MSLGGSSFSRTEDEVYRRVLNEDNVILVASAGNDGNSVYNYPASYESVMSVAAVDMNGNRASFSQFNDQVDIAAPGARIKSTLPNRSYGLKSGTSMASPHVAGVAALVWSLNPDRSAKEIWQALTKTAKKKAGTTGRDNMYGHGVVQAAAAAEYLSLPSSGDPTDSDFFEIRSTWDSNLCLDLKGADTTNGNRIWLYPCNHTRAQKWSRSSDGYLRSYIGTNKCIVGVGGSSATSTTLMIHDCYANDDRFRWNFYTDFSFRPSKNTSVCVFPATPLVDGRYQAALFPCSGTDVDAWYSRYNPLRRRDLLLDTSDADDLVPGLVDGGAVPDLGVASALSDIAADSLVVVPAIGTADD